ncbi:MAG: Pterin binding enzyme [Methanosaeta sp. PtaU1.Bin016]|jgi:dihydropteroate synthase-like protein|nr:MAG: Pterin binding enzyme [Methanosaeta sp. PtaU1.Bin016]
MRDLISSQPNANMKVLVVTGRLAQDLVKESSQDAEVLVLDLDVAAFITPEMLRRAAPAGYDLILIPGSITADFQEVERALGTKIRLGPKHAADLGFVLRHIEDVELSRTIPACVLLEEKMRKDASLQGMMLEAKAEATLEIEGVKIGGGSRMKVLAEIVDCTRLGAEAFAEKIRYYEEQGADMIDLGLPLDAKPSQVAEAVRNAKKITRLPVSVDTVRPDLILAGLDGGADLILSLNGENLESVGEAVAAACVPGVIIPGPGMASLTDNLQLARKMGIPVIADPVLDPPLQGLVSSLHRYILFRQAHPEVPLFFGAGNVTELLDADTHGVNALLAALGAEVGACILFTPECSAKARGSVRELRRASEMMQLASNRRTAPKDLGLDLLLLKEKRPKPEETMPDRFVLASSDHRYHPDPAGSFRIFLSKGMILARNRRVTVAGTSAKDILNTLIKGGFVSRLDHAGYLGRELEKAEIALSLGRSYVQDESLLPLDKS